LIERSGFGKYMESNRKKDKKQYDLKEMSKLKIIDQIIHFKIITIYI
jgi:hypothetical protein